APAAPRPPGAPPVPGAPRTETGATTAPLTKTMPMKPMAAPRPPGGAGTGPMSGASGGLPKATVKLQQTQPMQRPAIGAPPSAPVKRAAAADSQQFYEETDPDAGLMPLSVVCFLLSLGLLAVQMLGGDIVKSEDNSPIMVPYSQPAKWETYNKEAGTWTNRFASQLPVLPQ
ncbi:MAG TPA: hypothetical protein PLP58_22480, partial [Prosthecobacter sp.]|nr:hypothetical protein [Prosthecobacter sp.]